MTYKKVDETWKAQMRAEKERLAAQASNTTDIIDSAEAESLILGLAQALFFKLQHATDPQEAVKLAKTLQAMYQKMKGNLTPTEEKAFYEVTSVLRPILGLKEEPDEDSSPPLISTPTIPFR